jgi:pre-mRNA-splicing factor 18
MNKKFTENSKQESDTKKEDKNIDDSLSNLSESNVPQEFELKISNKEWILKVDPKTTIKEINEQGEIRKFIDVDAFSSDFKCDQLYIWFHKMFQEWEYELDALPLEYKKSAEGRQKLGIYKQCRGYIKPLLRLLKKKEAQKEIMNKLFEVMLFSLDRDYIRAHDKYIELAIGNAPWPMGVTMVGIHERSGRSRIYTSQVAHILNDDTTKKYLQSVKRIMSLVQRKYPNAPSNCVYS